MGEQTFEMLGADEDSGDGIVNQSISGFFSSRSSEISKNGKCNCGKIGSDGKIGSAERHILAFVRIGQEKGSEII